VERTAEAAAQLAVGSSQLLASGDPVKLVQPFVDKMEHAHAAQLCTILLQRFLGTASGRLPALDPLAAVAEQLALPTLARLEASFADHPAFQSAASIAPLLARAAALGGQCCCAAVREVSAQLVLLPLARALKMLSEVISEAVLERLECFRPLNASVISRAHQAFAACQVEIAQAAAAGGVAAEAARALAPAPERPSHQWRNAELKQFWEKRCAPRHEGGVPIDALAVLLLRATGIEVTHEHREAVMKRLAALEVREKGRVAPAELDRCGPEVRRCGGFRAWANAVLVSDGAEARPPVPASLSTPRGAGMASTWAPATSARSAGASTRALSARTAGSTFPAREPRRPFVLTSTLTGHTARGGGDGNPLLDSVERNLLSTTKRLVLGEKAPAGARYATFCDTPLHSAAVRDCKHAPMATFLLERGADANAEDKNLATPLHVAASTGHGEFARRLVEAGANVQKEDRWAATPLHKAANSGQTEVVGLLLRSGAGADAADEWGATPLHRAAARGQLAVAEQLLERGRASVNAEDRRGDRPLHVAAARGDYALVRLLLEHGGAATARDRVGGRTPADCARERGHTDVVTLLEHRQEWISVRSQAMVATN